MSISKGIKGLKDSQKAVEKSMSAGSGRNIFIQDTESYLCRFMLDGDDIVSGYFHRVPITKGDKSWYQEIQCEDNDCPYCNSKDDDVAKKTFRFLTWIWVYYIDHVDDNEDGEWEEVEKEDGIFYREEVSAPRLLKGGYYFSKVITAIYSKYGTLIDADYECVRSGKSLKTTYSLFREDKEPMAKNVKAAIKKLDDLEKMVGSKPSEEDDEEEEEKPKPKAKKAAAKKSAGKKGKRKPVEEEEEEELEEELDDDEEDDNPFE